MECSGFILVVDDDPDLGDALRQHIEGLGCRVVLAIDGMDALDCLGRSSTPPCVILTDLNMPKLDGVALVRCLRASETHQTTPVVTMSAERQRERSPHVRTHLYKPFGLSEIDGAVAHVCRGGPARSAA